MFWVTMIWFVNKYRPNSFAQFCIMLGVNFYRNRSCERRCLSTIILIVNCIISEIHAHFKNFSTSYFSDIYFVGYVLYLTVTKPFQAERVAVSISRGTWVVQATLSTVRPKSLIVIVNQRGSNVLNAALPCVVAVHQSALQSPQTSLWS